MATMFVAGAYKGLQERKAKNREAQAYLDASGRRMAAATRDAAEESRRRKVMMGRALAVSAASGAGVDTPTVVNLLGDLDAEGQYRMMSAMYLGQEEAAGLTYRADAARREAGAAFTAGIINGVTSALSVGYGMGAFGGRTPPPTTAAATTPTYHPFSRSGPPRRYSRGSR
jgi:hypothetical protein